MAYGAQGASAHACDLQDLDGFDADMTLKAIHASPGRPQAAVLTQSASLPLPPRRGELAQGTPSKARGLGRSASHTGSEQDLLHGAAGKGRSLMYTAGDAPGSAAPQQDGGADGAAEGVFGQVATVHEIFLLPAVVDTCGWGQPAV